MPPNQLPDSFLSHSLYFFYTSIQHSVTRYKQIQHSVTRYKQILHSVTRYKQIQQFVTSCKQIQQFATSCKHIQQFVTSCKQINFKDRQYPYSSPPVLTSLDLHIPGTSYPQFNNHRNKTM